MTLNLSTLLKKHDNTFQKKYVSEVIKSFELFYNRKDQEEVKDLYVAGSFSLVIE